MIYTFIAPIIVFAVIVIVHEWGHFITAKLTGMKVEEFAVGFGPVLWSIKKGSRIYRGPKSFFEPTGVATLISY